MGGELTKVSYISNYLHILKDISINMIQHILTLSRCEVGLRLDHGSIRVGVLVRLNCPVLSSGVDTLHYTHEKGQSSVSVGNKIPDTQPQGLPPSSATRARLYLS